MKALLEVVELKVMDIITTSNNGGGNDDYDPSKCPDFVELPGM